MIAARLKQRARPGLPYAGTTVARVGPSVNLANGLLRVHSGGRHLEHANGVRFPYIADTGWSLFMRTNLSEATAYFENRRAKGYTVIQCSFACPFTYVLVSRNDGVNIFTGGDVTAPNETFFAYVDALVDVAASKGIVLAIVCVWGNFFTVPKDMIDDFNTTTIANFGDFLEARYASKTNIIWITGGDENPDAGAQAKYNALGAALGTRFLRTFHPSGHTLSSTWFQSETWHQFSMSQSGHSAENNAESYSLVADGRAATPTKPTLQAEPPYENTPINWNVANGYFDSGDIRQGLYWGLFAGGLGAAYGNHAGWVFDRSPFIFESAPDVSLILWWEQAINQPVSLQMQHLRGLVDARPIAGATPDDTLVTDVSSGANRIVACRAANTAVHYIPQGAGFTCNFAKISGASVKAYWFNPRTGAVTFIATYTNSGTQAFTPPSSGAGNDWVLILDDASAQFPVPGLGVYAG